MKRTPFLFVLFSFIILLAACSSIDCPLNNKVQANYCIYNYRGDSIALEDSLSIVINRKSPLEDTVLINRISGKHMFSLTMSNNQREDEFYLIYWNKEEEYIDTIRVTKEDKPHFETVDCAATYFHTITDVWSTHNIIDSIVINHKTVDYDSQKKHFKLYLHIGF